MQGSMLSFMFTNVKTLFPYGNFPDIMYSLYTVPPQNTAGLISQGAVRV